MGVVGDFEAHRRVLLEEQHRNTLRDAEPLADDRRREPLRPLFEDQEARGLRTRHKGVGKWQQRSGCARLQQAVAAQFPLKLHILSGFPFHVLAPTEPLLLGSGKPGECAD